jgi:nucleoside-diphosphate-sugar epimerase
MATGVCAITGASGYVGSRMVNHLASAGWEVRALCRSRPRVCGERVSHLPFDLAAGPAPSALEGVDVLVHAAYDFSHARRSEIARVNVDGSRRLLAATLEAGIERIVYVSTVAAFPGARSMYGRAKLEVERMAMALGAAVIRCGLVWGPESGAMFGAMRHAVDRLPIVPVIGPTDLRLALVHEDDLALLLERVLDSWPEAQERLFVAASERTITFVELLRSLSRDPAHRPRLVPVSWMLVWSALRGLETLGMVPPFRSDSLVSLIHADTDPLARATARAERYGVSFRDYAPV